MATGEELGTAGSKTSVDLATIIGIIGGFGLIASAIIVGGSPRSFVNIPSILIVICGTFAVTTACFTLREMLQSFTVVLQAVISTHRDPTSAAVHVLQLAETARKQGVLALQSGLQNLSDEPFLHKGIILVVDGTPGDEIEAIMRKDMIETLRRHSRSAGILRRAAEFAPAMGLIGTLIGLVQMLGNLEDPASIGPAMAVALLTTFYGAVLANVFFLPLATKLERNSTEESMVNQVYLMGATSIGRQENPRRLEMLLNTALPPSKRVRYFD